MNIIKFIESFTNEGIINSKGSRRDSFTQFGKLGSSALAAAAPLGLLSMVFAPKARAASSTFLSTAAETPTAALQLALTLEYLEKEFYNTALQTSGLIPAADRIVFETIAQHETAHVTLLANALGSDAPAVPTFDFTANGVFSPFTDYQQFLALAQAFEDTGARAYKGQAANLMSNGDLLTTALQIHSVEARHAAQIRRMRDLKGWITGNDEGGHPAQADAVYANENVSTQLGFNTGNVNNFGVGAGTESFDEPLTGDQSRAIASLFIG